jgi:hypothetical protein
MTAKTDAIYAKYAGKGGYIDQHYGSRPWHYGSAEDIRARRKRVPIDKLHHRNGSNIDKSRAIIAVEPDGTETRYESILGAAYDAGLNRRTISNYVRGITPQRPGETQYRYADSGFAKKEYIGYGRRNGKEVVCIYFDGRERRYKSLKEASEAEGVSMANICNCLRGRIKTAGGKEWEYGK